MLSCALRIYPDNLFPFQNIFFQSIRREQMIKAVKHVSIAVRNQDKALDFFHNKLGFEIVCDVPFGKGQRWIELKIPGADTQIVLFTPDGHENRIGTFSNVVFTCSDIDKTYEDLQGK